MIIIKTFNDGDAKAKHKKIKKKSYQYDICSTSRTLPLLIALITPEQCIIQ